MKIGVVTLFPQIIQSLQFGVTGRAIKQGILQLDCWNPRDYTRDVHRTVDDRPYGGGPGMVMMVEPIRAALHAAKKSMGLDTKIIYVSPQGQQFSHAATQQFAQQKALIFLAGRYEGIDERLIDLEVDEQWSLGDYVLSGGELAACVMIDAMSRQIPGVLGDVDSAQQDSFVDGLLDCPHYTRPEGCAGLPVPKVLLSGNHHAIKQWRLKQALGRTWQRRADLLAKRCLTKQESILLNEFKRDIGRKDHE
ncbi:MAG: tRNA (guanosine(37)-N1)-methyltransferase TrmD [Gammaproteobacteria bacterium]|nr:tRNA (guanosine(37)-N1)-methyltransferase TrmD [Gammaproteobacteria bacterium]